MGFVKGGCSFLFLFFFFLILFIIHLIIKMQWSLIPTTAGASGYITSLKQPKWWIWAEEQKPNPSRRCICMHARKIMASQRSKRWKVATSILALETHWDHYTSLSYLDLHKYILKLDSGIGSSRDCLFMNYLAVPDAAVAIMHSLDAAYSYFWQELSSWGAVLLDVTGQNMNTLYCFSCRVRVHPLWGQF